MCSSLFLCCLRRALTIVYVAEAAGSLRIQVKQIQVPIIEAVIVALHWRECLMAKEDAHSMPEEEPRLDTGSRQTFAQARTEKTNNLQC
jgi:hypothetical protein